MNKAYLLTGSNMGDRVNFLDKAAELAGSTAGKVIRKSGVYETAAWGKTDQPAFLNQALMVETALNAQELMQQLLTIEETIGRKRVEKFGPRTIDIDILLFNDEIHDTALTEIPHPELPNRRFALTPLAEIAGELMHPVLQVTIEQLLDTCPDPLPIKKWNATPKKHQK